MNFTSDLIDAGSERALQLLVDAIPIDSLSAVGRNLEEGARHFAAVLDAAGIPATIWQGQGAPTVFGHKPAAAGRPTILFYGHYDVQPSDPDSAWLSPPFEATIRDGAVFGRGTGDNKGQLLAHVAAVAELIRRDELDVGVKFLIEGEEEIGSPHLASVVERHAADLGATGAITADAPVHDDGRAVVIFGVRGLLFIEVELAGAPRDLHSGNRGGIAPTPAWELVEALATLRGPDGVVAAPGFYDEVQPPTPAEREMLEALPIDHEVFVRDLGPDAAARWEASSPWLALGFEPNCNLAGLTAGYQGSGAKTVIPATARAKIDFRLVANQNPADVFRQVRDHLLAHNPDLHVSQLAAVPPSSTNPEDPFARAVRQAVARASGEPPLLRPRLGGTTPDYVFTQILEIPSVLVPYGPPDMNHHAPNEKMTLECLRRGVACTAAICRHLGQDTPGR